MAFVNAMIDAFNSSMLKFPMPSLTFQTFGEVDCSAVCGDALQKLVKVMQDAVSQNMILQNKVMQDAVSLTMLQTTVNEMHAVVTKPSTFAQEMAKPSAWVPNAFFTVISLVLGMFLGHFAGKILTAIGGGYNTIKQTVVNAYFRWRPAPATQVPAGTGRDHHSDDAASKTSPRSLEQGAIDGVGIGPDQDGPGAGADAPGDNAGGGAAQSPGDVGSAGAPGPGASVSAGSD